MDIQIACVVNGNTEYIELFGNESFTMDISFAEIQDITKKNSAYSKEINVPGSKQNNYIFNYFFDLNQVPLNFTPNKKFETSILYNGYVIASGYIRLNNVVVTGLEKTYNITFYNGVGDVAASIGDKFMVELDLDHLSHPFTPDVYLQSTLDPNLFPMTGTTNYSYQNGKTFWGLYNIGYNYVNSLSGVSSYYVGTSSSSVAITSGSKTILTATDLPFLVGDTIRLTNAGSGYWIQGLITSKNGTTITFRADLALGTGTFNSWDTSIQTVEGTTVTDADTTPLLDFQTPTIPNYMSFSGTPVRNYYFKPSIQIKELYEQIFQQSGYNVESHFFDTSYFEKYYLPLKFLDETVYTKGSIVPCYSWQYSANTPNQGITCNNIPFSADSTSLLIDAAYEGEYTFEVLVESLLPFQTPPSCGALYSLDLDINGTLYNVNTITDCDEYGGSYYASIAGRVTVTLTGTSVITVVPPSFASDTRLVQFSIVNGPRVIVGNFNYSNEFPSNDFKQIDFITSVNKYFNLICVPHITKPKTLVVEPIIDYIGKGEILDWTEKIDWDSPITVSPTTNLLNGTLMFNFKLDQDYANQQFNIANNRVFGTYELQLNQDYKDNKIEFNTIFSSPIDTTLNNSNLPNITISNFATIKTQEFNGVSIQKFQPYKILPRIIFRGPVLPNDNWGLNSGTTQSWWAESNQIDRWQETNRFTTYPFSYTGFSHYINYNAADTFSPLESTFPTQQDMYDVYYYDYISDIISPENKIISAKIYLTPYEIANLEFNEKIIIKNAYFRVNKISGYNLSEPSLCNIELIKLTKDYTSHPVQYYDLINCTSGGTNYHTTSDLNYNMYAYVGNYVNIFTGQTTGYTSIGCFGVQLGQPNPNYDYEQVFIGSGYTTSGVNIYNDCGCSGRTQMTVVQENYIPPTEPPVPSPTPTPSTTSTPTPTPTPIPCVCFSSITYSYSGVPSVQPIIIVEYCNGRAPSSFTATGSGSSTRTIDCNVNGGFTSYSASTYITSVSLNGCCGPDITNTPTPTPTNTPTNTQTPTNTGTPTNTPTNTGTPTNTPTNTETPTNTPTPTSTSAAVALILDTYTGSSIAYSTRLLKSSYGGSCLRVRRSSDNAEQDIGFSGGSIDETALTNFITGTTDGRVTVWYDQSGNNVNLTQTTAIKQPYIVSGGTVFKYSGKVVLKTIQTSSGPSNIGMVQSTDITNPFCFVGAFLEETSASALRAFSSNNQNALISSRRTNSNTVYTEATIYNSTWGSNNVMQVTFFNKTGTTSTLFTNTTQLLSGTTGNNKLGTIGVGAANIFTPSEGTNGKFGEMIAWNLNQTSNRAGIISDIQTYWV